VQHFQAAAVRLLSSRRSFACVGTAHDAGVLGTAVQMLL
jgi:hypothetical protein